MKAESAISLEAEPADQGVSLAKQLSQLEQSWNEHSGEAQYAFFARAGAIASRLFERPRAEADAAAIHLLRSLLSKHSPPPEVGAADLVAQLKIARFIMANSATTQARRQAQAEVLAELMQRIREELCVDYQEKPVSLNVAPADGGSGLNFAGQSPDSIEDLAKRDRYRQAICQNQSNNLANSRQAELRKMQSELAAIRVEAAPVQ